MCNFPFTHPDFLCHFIIYFDKIQRINFSTFQSYLSGINLFVKLAVFFLRGAWGFMLNPLDRSGYIEVLYAGRPYSFSNVQYPFGINFLNNPNPCIPKVLTIGVNECFFSKSEQLTVLYSYESWICGTGESAEH